MKQYLLGNKTQELIDTIKKNPYSPELINLVVTRSQTKAAPDRQRSRIFFRQHKRKGCRSGSSTMSVDNCDGGNNSLNEGEDRNSTPAEVDSNTI
ncbi:hypothetical protein AVEN_189211-1 [Araneus ventricosus]|uniref:Uncharacterized protein n=1 Tax=Araneus ventricosus TaxID=182803 RepID=A0A4Y2TDI1_ARAVE|nr:hypothetical protein AVEN_189211-1 [Araneus ventricosus]